MNLYLDAQAPLYNRMYHRKRSRIVLHPGDDYMWVICGFNGLNHLRGYTPRNSRWLKNPSRTLFVSAYHLLSWISWPMVSFLLVIWMCLKMGYTGIPKNGDLWETHGYTDADGTGEPMFRQTNNFMMLGRSLSTSGRPKSHHAPESHITAWPR